MSDTLPGTRLAQEDAAFLELTLGDDISNALAVFLCDPFLREVLGRLDPKAVEQARRALGLPDIVEVP